MLFGLAQILEQRHNIYCIIFFRIWNEHSATFFISYCKFYFIHVSKKQKKNRNFVDQLLNVTLLYFQIVVYVDFVYFLVDFVMYLVQATKLRLAASNLKCFEYVSQHCSFIYLQLLIYE
jgi:hypothetical protein